MRARQGRPSRTAERACARAAGPGRAHLPRAPACAATSHSLAPARLGVLPSTIPSRTRPSYRAAAPHDLAAYLALLRTDGRLVMVGLPPDPLALPAFAVTAREWQSLPSVCLSTVCCREGLAGGCSPTRRSCPS